ncbi:hypothetical protein V8J84_10215 [Yoonia sp. 208BN28-4]
METMKAISPDYAEDDRQFGAASAVFNHRATSGFNFGIFPR